MTLLELSVALMITGLILSSITAITVRSLSMLGTNRDALNVQQGIQSLRSRFVADIRQASAMVTSVSDPTRFTLRSFTPQGVAYYVTYRIANGQLQRGESTDATLNPPWTALIDPKLFTVTSARFTYWAANEQVAADASTVRRLDLNDLQLRSWETRTSSGYGPLSAAMREDPTSTLTLVPGTSNTGKNNTGSGNNGNDKGVGNAGSNSGGNGPQNQGTASPRIVALNFVNSSGVTIRIAAFSMTFGNGASTTYLAQLVLNGDKKNRWTGTYYSDGNPVSLSFVLGVNNQTRANLWLKFSDAIPSGSRLTINLYDQSDRSFNLPYTIDYIVP